MVNEAKGEGMEPIELMDEDGRTRFYLGLARFLALREALRAGRRQVGDYLKWAAQHPGTIGPEEKEALESLHKHTRVSLSGGEDNSGYEQRVELTEPAGDDDSSNPW